MGEGTGGDAASLQREVRPSRQPPITYSWPGEMIPRRAAPPPPPLCGRARLSLYLSAPGLPLER